MVQMDCFHANQTMNRLILLTNTKNHHIHCPFQITAAQFFQIFCTTSTAASVIIPLHCNIPCAFPKSVCWMVMCRRQPSSTSNKCLWWKIVVLIAYILQNHCWLITWAQYHFISLSIMQVAAVVALFLYCIYTRFHCWCEPSLLLYVRIFAGLALTKAITFHTYYQREDTIRFLFLLFVLRYLYYAGTALDKNLVHLCNLWHIIYRCGIKCHMNLN